MDRVFWLFEKKKKGYIQELISTLKKGETFKLNFPNLKRDYISTEQAAKLITRLFYKKINGSFNVCGKSLTLKKSKLALKELKSGKIIYGKSKKVNNIYGEAKEFQILTFKSYNVERDLVKYLRIFY